MAEIDIERTREHTREIRENLEKIRNLLVHRYWEIDPLRVLRYARENLGDFEAFLAAIKRLAEQGE
jgi:uncharacterized protein YutE (UPF0331/DUF86 family)